MSNSRNKRVPQISKAVSACRGSPVRPTKIHSYPVTKDEHKQYVQLFRDIEMKSDYPSPANTDDCMECPHTETEVINGVIECLDCGQHLDQVVDQEQEWRYYGDNDNKNINDPSRCQFRKSPDKGIRKDLDKLNLPGKVVNLADQYYCEVTQGEIKRGNLRKGIMFACVFEAYKDINKCQMPDPLRKLFEIDKKNGSRGLTYFYRRKKKSDREYITAEHFIPKICEKFNFTESAIEEVKELYRTLKSKSPKLDHSYPQSVACGCVYYTLKSKNIDITGEQFGKIVGLSSITVSKKCNEIEDIINEE